MNHVYGNKMRINNKLILTATLCIATLVLCMCRALGNEPEQPHGSGRIYCVAEIDLSWELICIDLADDSYQQLTQTALDERRPSAPLNGNLIAYESTNGRIRIMDGFDQTEDIYPYSSSAQYDGELCFYPDGNKLCFVSWNDRRLDDTDIGIYDITTKEYRIH